MVKTEVKPTHKSVVLSPGNVPVDVRAMAVNKEVRDFLQELHASGASVTYHKLKSVPLEVRGHVHGEHNPDKLIEKAISSGEEGEDPKIGVVRKEAQGAVIFSVKNSGDKPVTPQQQQLLDALNGHDVVRTAREKHAERKLKHSRPPKVLKRFGVIGGAEVLAGVGAHFAENSGNHFVNAAGYVLTEFTDDIGNIVAVSATEQGGKKNFKEVKDDVKPLAWILPVVAALDYFAIPQLLESSAIVSRLFGGFLFSVTGFAGSVGANIKNFYDTNKRIRETNKELSTKQRWKQAWEDHTSDPFRKNIWRGSAASLLLGVGTASLDVLSGKAYSTALQVLVGSMETIPAFAAVAFASPSSEFKEQIDNWIKVKKTKEPIDIFVSKK